MSNMTNPMNALNSLQVEILKGFHLQPCEGNKNIKMLLDYPNGELRHTYAIIENKVLKALVTFIPVEPINQVPCFNIGYAVNSKYRNKGLAKKIIKMSISELSRGLGKHGIKKLYIEAIVGVNNIASQKVAQKLFSTEFEVSKDAVSGEECHQYIKLVESKI